MTYIWTRSRWSYLAVVLDLFGRKVVSWTPDSELTMQALMMTYENRGKPKGLFFIQTKERIIRAGSLDSAFGVIK